MRGAAGEQRAAAGCERGARCCRWGSPAAFPFRHRFFQRLSCRKIPGPGRSGSRAPQAEPKAPWVLLSSLPRLVREFVAQNNTSQIKHVIQILSQEFALSQHPHSRKGGLIGLAACSIALGKVGAGGGCFAACGGRAGERPGGTGALSGQDRPSARGSGASAHPRSAAAGLGSAGWALISVKGAEERSLSLCPPSPTQAAPAAQAEPLRSEGKVWAQGRQSRGQGKRRCEVSSCVSLSRQLGRCLTCRARGRLSPLLEVSCRRPLHGKSAGPCPSEEPSPGSAGSRLRGAADSPQGWAGKAPAGEGVGWVRSEGSARASSGFGKSPSCV